MNEPEEKNPTQEEKEQDTVSDLLRFAERRTPLPEERAARMRAAVHAHWKSTLHQDRKSRKRIWLGRVMAAAAVIILFVFTMQTKRDLPVPPSIRIGVLQVASGTIQIQKPGSFSHAKAGSQL
ncbi:MAG TPA: hypothetical protein VLH08_10170, partial [Acidobacteriota bacterium]|nr:hypothetical protein [Acidobacteriota bacterium]